MDLNDDAITLCSFQASAILFFLFSAPTNKGSGACDDEPPTPNGLSHAELIN
jgi:hypothetical protein